ncbi:hypothetical protein D3C76_1493140 [compost metagenome]
MQEALDPKPLLNLAEEQYPVGNDNDQHQCEKRQKHDQLACIMDGQRRVEENDKADQRNEQNPLQPEGKAQALGNHNRKQPDQHHLVASRHQNGAQVNQHTLNGKIKPILLRGHTV